MEPPPDPFDLLRRESPAEVDVRRRWARALPFARLADTPWLGHPVRVRVAAPAPAPPATVQPVVGVLFEQGAARFAWTWSPALAGRVLERSLGGDEGEPLHGPLSEMERGVLTYATARWIAESRWTVAGVFAHAPALDEALGAGPLERWPMTLELGPDTFETHLRLNLALPAPAPASKAPDDLPVTCAVHAGVATLPVRTVRGLSLGDVVVPDVVSVDARGEGPVRIFVRGTRRAYDAVRAAGGLTVTRRVEGEHVTVAPQGGDMSASMEGMEQLPVTLSLELARFELPLADVAALAPGEVVRTGATHEGHQVVLRAGDRVVAVGELVTVGDEIGVRIVEVPARS
ncbi:MAG: FliM/FliN family flagellar motor switch protein [Sandaracinaceae bacterium]